MGVQQHLDLEAEIESNAIADKKPKIREEFVQVQEHRIFTLNAEPLTDDGDRKLAVILLHDQINNSYAWMETNTIQTLAFYGYTAIALDLPSHGRSSGPILNKPSERSDFLSDFLDVKKLDHDSVIFLGVSMAGQFIISYLNNCTEVKQISGLIGIGLSDTHELDQKAILPNTLLIRGELDLSIGLNASNAWKHRENVRQFVIPNAKHLCHINNPQLFNKVLINFLNSISV